VVVVDPHNVVMDNNEAPKTGCRKLVCGERIALIHLIRIMYLWLCGLCVPVFFLMLIFGDFGLEFSIAAISVLLFCGLSLCIVGICCAEKKRGRPNNN
jgi:hypothetical protein